MEKEKKNVKKVKKNKINYNTTEQEEIKKFLIVVLVVLIGVGAIYLLTRVFITKDLFQKEDPVVETVQEGKPDDSVTIMGQLLNRPYKEYYAIAYDQSKIEVLYEMMAIVESYNNVDKHLHIYSIDTSNVMNKDYYDPENVKLDAKTLEEVKLGDKTLIKVKNGKIDKIIVDVAEMKKELGIEKKDEK